MANKLAGKFAVLYAGRVARARTKGPFSRPIKFSECFRKAPRYKALEDEFSPEILN